MNIFTRKVLSVILLFIVSSVLVQAQEFGWSKQFTSTGKDYGNGITVAPNGDIYVTGEFTGTLTLADGVSITSAGNVDFFLARLNSAGLPLWARKGGGTLTDRGYGVKVDLNGDVIATGPIYGTVTYESVSLTSAGNLDFIVAKYDSLGTLKWIKQGKSVSQTITRAVAVDSSNNIIIVGYFGTTNVDTLNYEGLTVTSNGNRDGFLIKLDNDGNPLWGVNTGGIESDEEIKAVDVDAAGNIYVAGTCNDTAYFSGTAMYNYGGRDIFFAKYTADGKLSWVKTAGGISDDDANGISLDGKGGLYVCGYIDGDGSFLGSPFTAVDTLDTYVAKLDTSGNLVWLQSGGSVDVDYATSVKYSPMGVYVTGYFKQTYTLQNKSVTSAGNEDVYVANFDENGTLNWILSAGGTDVDKSMACAVDASGTYYGTGYFKGTTKLGETSYTSAGAEDVFVFKIINNIVPVELTAFNAAVIKSGVKLSWSTATETNNSGFQVERKYVNSAWETLAFVEGKGTTSGKTSYSYTDNTASSGKYSYRLKQVDFDGTYKYSGMVEVNTAVPSKFEVFQNYPNPFNPVTNIKFNIPVDANVKISLINMLGEEIVLANGDFSAGTNEIVFNGAGYSSGTYVYVVKATSTDGSLMTSSKKLVLLK